MPLRFAYNTSGCSNHRLDDALVLIAEAGYDGVALTLDHHHFDPFAPRLAQRIDRLDRRLRQLRLGLVIETGARFLLDPRRKHEPTLISPEPAGRARRIDFLRRAVDICAGCGGEAVSFWSGIPQPGLDPREALRWLLDGASVVVRHARSRGVTPAFEPEPAMLVETCDQYAHLARDIPGLTLALDTGHPLVTGEGEPHDLLRRFAPQLGTVAIEDMRRGVHEHLPFGRGDMDIPAVLSALREIDFRRLVCVELSRESHRAHEAIPEAIAHLRASSS